MRLCELDPRWLVKDGVRVGFIFRCPTKPRCWQSCFVASPARSEQWALFAEIFGRESDGTVIGRPDVQGCTQGTHWEIAGGIDTATFETLTVTPSLDGSAGGNWHGYITNGEIVGGL
jgi:hypothetical protein